MGTRYLALIGACRDCHKAGRWRGPHSERPRSAALVLLVEEIAIMEAIRRAYGAPSGYGGLEA
jgi:hypothetical protein